MLKVEKLEDLKPRDLILWHHTDPYPVLRLDKKPDGRTMVYFNWSQTHRNEAGVYWEDKARPIYRPAIAPGMWIRTLGGNVPHRVEGIDNNGRLVLNARYVKGQIELADRIFADPSIVVPVFDPEKEIPTESSWEEKQRILEERGPFLKGDLVEIVGLGNSLFEVVQERNVTSDSTVLVKATYGIRAYYVAEKSLSRPAFKVGMWVRSARMPHWTDHGSRISKIAALPGEREERLHFDTTFDRGEIFTTSKDSISYAFNNEDWIPIADPTKNVKQNDKNEPKVEQKVEKDARRDYHKGDLFTVARYESITFELIDPSFGKPRYNMKLKKVGEDDSDAPLRVSEAELIRAPLKRGGWARRIGSRELARVHDVYAKTVYFDYTSRDEGMALCDHPKFWVAHTPPKDFAENSPELRKEVKELRVRFEKKLIASERQCELLESSNRVLRDNLAERSKELADARAEVEKLKDAHGRAFVTFVAAQQDSRRLEAAIKSKESRIEDLDQQRYAAEQDKEKLLKENRELADTVSKLRQAVTEANNWANGINSEAVCVATENNQLRKAVEVLQERVEAQEKRYALLHNLYTAKVAATKQKVPRVTM